jgi:branched-subunit amino acid transport protein AzlD
MGERKKKPQWLRYMGFTSLGVLAIAAVVRFASQEVGTDLVGLGSLIGICWIVGSWIWSAFAGVIHK